MAFAQATTRRSGMCRTLGACPPAVDRSMPRSRGRHCCCQSAAREGAFRIRQRVRGLALHTTLPSGASLIKLQPHRYRDGISRCVKTPTRRTRYAGAGGSVRSPRSKSATTTLVATSSLARWWEMRCPSRWLSPCPIGWHFAGPHHPDQHCRHLRTHRMGALGDQAQRQRRTRHRQPERPTERGDLRRGIAVFGEWMKNDNIKVDSYVGGIDVRF